MNRSATGILILAAIVASILYLWQPWNSGASPLKLGLDLQGGLRVTLQSDQDDPVREDLEAARDIIDNRRMAIVLDGNIVTAPTLQSRISDSGQITGIGTLDEASDIAVVLRSGSLP